MENLLMVDDMIKDSHQSWKQALLLSAGLSLFAAIFVLPIPTNLALIAPWQILLWQVIVAAIATIVLQFYTTILYVSLLAPFVAIRAMARFVTYRVIIPFVLWLVAKVRKARINRPVFTRRFEQIIRSIASLFSPKHGAYKLHAVTQTLLYYS
jgi:uncharacterized membrane protein